LNEGEGQGHLFI